MRSAEVLQSGGSSGAAAHAGLGEILGAAREARTLVRELLAYAGRQPEVLLHLVEHARESMPDGGYVVVATEEVELDEASAREHPSTRTGPHALLAVSDTGRGMDEETQARIFEPFFSTRARGAGGGMGLATVYGMVKQLGGSIWVTSRPGVGTTFRVYLSRVEA